MMGWEKRSTESDAIAGDRRQDRRYEINLDVKWKLISAPPRSRHRHRGKPLICRAACILFDAGRHLPEGLNVELSITWPVLLHNVAPMQLLASGKIVRSTGRKVAIQTVQHEFRTVGISAEQRSTMPQGGRQPPVSNRSAFIAFSKVVSVTPPATPASAVRARPSPAPLQVALSAALPPRASAASGSPAH